jgi:glucose-1-phosphate adenylyltransferase
MRGNNVLGIIFSNINEEKIRELTEKRTLGSVPIGGRYRLIDFTLSNMVNSGINKVGVITKSNYQSLMDHLGAGKPWDLSRKRDGLFILPPFFGGNSNEFTNRIQTLDGISRFLADSKEDYILLSDCDVICNIDFKDVITFAQQKDADITMIYTRGKVPENVTELAVLSLEPDGRIKDLIIDPNTSDEYSFTFNMTLIKKDLLLKLVRECCSRNRSNFKKDLLQRNVSRYRMYGYQHKGYSHIISSMNEFYSANMELMKTDVREELFNSGRPIFTKVRDDMPAKYGLSSKVKNSTIGNGCVIEGEVENSVLFRGVHIEKGAKVSNCVIMQDTKVSSGSNIQYIITDKDVIIKEDRNLMGFESYPIYISKASIV